MRTLRPHRLPARWTLFASSFMVGVMLLICIFVILVNATGRSTVPKDSVGGFMRGGQTIIMIRLPGTAGSEGIMIIYDDGHIIPPAASAGRIQNMQLSEDTMSRVKALRDQWCQKKPLFPTMQSEDPYYVVGLSCSILRVSEVRVPADQLPAVLKEFVQTSSP